MRKTMKKSSSGTISADDWVNVRTNHSALSRDDQNNNNPDNRDDKSSGRETDDSAKRVLLRRRRIPPEVFEGSVDPSSESDGLRRQTTIGRLASDFERDAGFSKGTLWRGRAITVVGTLLLKNNRADYDEKEHVVSDAPLRRPPPREEVSTSRQRSLLCRECPGGTFFGLYQDPPTPKKKVVHNSSASAGYTHNRWERGRLPEHSTFTPHPPSQDPYKNVHAYVPEIRYKPVYFGDQRYRRYSQGHSDLSSKEITVTGLQDFCRTMLTVKTPDYENGIIRTEFRKYEDPGRKCGGKEKRDVECGDAKEHSPEHNKASTLPRTVSKATPTPLRSPKLVKEVLKRMSSQPSGRDPQVVSSFSEDEEEEDEAALDQETMKVIDEFDRALTEVVTRRMEKETLKKKPRNPGLQSDNLVEEVLLADPKYEKVSRTTSATQYEDTWEEDGRLRSLSTSPAPPKPPRNYDSLPRGFKPSDGEAKYDSVSSGIHPLTNGLNVDETGISSSPQQNYFVVVAVDFGTTYSGYAFSFTRDPDNVHMMRKWEGGDPGVVNQKTPTTLLLTPDERFHSFGYAARDHYHDLDPEDAKRWLYFDKFKMTLHSTETLCRDTTIQAANGRAVPALAVFSFALRYFRDHALQELSDQSATVLIDDDVRWVVTVPAIWRQPAKQFMRTAAYQAGIASSENPEQLLIALEPEAASIFCRRLRMHQLVPLASYPQRLSLPNVREAANESANQEPAVIENAGTRYLVVDCGGGTVDITVHEIVDERGTLKELHRATGGPVGSVGVDQQFEHLLQEIFGQDFVGQFKFKKPAAFVDLMVAFEARKRNASPFKITPINISLPFSFIDCYKKSKNGTVESAVKKHSSKEIKWSSQGMLRLEPACMYRLFQLTLDAICSHVRGVLDDCGGGISYLFLVGGFAESAVLQKSIRDAFEGELKVIIPQDVSLAILKGAVQFGLDPTVINSRRSRLTYGVGVLNRFIHGTHPPDKLVVKDGVEWCADVFDKFVVTDQSVCCGDTVIRRYTPARTGQACSVIHIYCSEKEDAVFITDPGVKRCGTLVLDLSGDLEMTSAGGKREIQTRMVFGDTELKVSALDLSSGRCVKAEIDFLNG